MYTLTQYKNDIERRKIEVIPGIFDISFKSILSIERAYLADIINGITKIPKKAIKERALIINSEHIVENIEEGRKTSDLVIEVDSNIINMEMNREYYVNLVKRNNKYAQKLSYMNSYDKTIIQINFNMFNLYNDDRTIIKFEMMDSERGLIDKTNIIKYEVNLELIYKKYYNKEKLTDLEKKLLMLVLKNREELKKLSRGDALMEKVNKRLEELSDDKYAWLIYDREERMKEEAKLVAEYKAEKKYEDKMKKVDKQLQKANEQIKKANEQTKKANEQTKKANEQTKKANEQTKKANEQTRKANEQKKEIAKNMLRKNIDINLISEITGLSIEEIN